MIGWEEGIILKYFEEENGVLFQGDCLEVMKNIEDESVDMVITSPPYANQRKDSYNSVSEDKYINWFRPIAKEIKRILKPSGSFFLNIKPHVVNGQRSCYVFDLILSLVREVGFNYIDELCWVKNPYPIKSNKRFKNSFEPIYHFSKTIKIKFNPLACGTQVKECSYKRAKRKICGSPKNGSNLNMDHSNILNIELARPSNVINVNNVVNQYSLKKEHPATFPEALVDFFIKSFSDEVDVVLDPFVGSGTTLVASKNLNRKYIGIDLEEKYCEIAKKRLLGEV